MVYYIDNDIILLNETLGAWEIKRSDIRVLASARFSMNTSNRRKKYGQDTVNRAIDFVTTCNTIPSQDTEEYRLLLSQSTNGMDMGEAILISSLIQENATLLLTGDKRCLNCLATTESLTLIHKKMQGRVICLEQLIHKTIGTLEFEIVLERILPVRDIDTALKSAFGSGNRCQYQAVLDNLMCYVEDLQTTSGGILYL
jgi:hypothetical protein